MLSGLFKTKSALSRFESTEAFTQPIIIINKLRTKELELKQAAEHNGIGSIDYRKHSIIAGLIQKIDNVITTFNEKKSADEITDIIQTTRKIAEIISAVRRTNEETLMTRRNHQRENVSDAIYYTAFGSTCIAGSAISIGSLGKLATLFYIAPTVSKSIHEATGFNDLSPTSVRLLNELTTVLNNINANLTKQSNGEPEEKQTEIEDFICPITQEIIIDPVVCTLDGHAYERSAIEEWFKHNPRSPMNREEIPIDKTPKDVLISHYNYASLLEKYRREHPIRHPSSPH